MKHTHVVYSEEERRRRLAAAYRVLIEAAARKHAREAGERSARSLDQSDQFPS